MTPKILKPGQILKGSLFNELMRIETVRQTGPDTWALGLVGTQSEKFRNVTLTSKDIETLTIFETTSTFDGDGKLLRLGLQAYSLGIAYEFDPYFGLSISRVDPLPHQLEAVYDYLLKLARVKFLLADDAGAGKTIMAGLLIRELKLRGLAERALIVCPANLTFQWQRELNEKFDEKFKVIKGSEIRDQFGINQWMEQNQIITSLDLAKRSEILQGLRQAHWDLVIVDEAHRMSAADREHKTQRYRLGELLRDSSDHLLLLTATPHKGDPVNFTFFLQLLDEDAYADVRSIRTAMEQRRAPFYLRRIKEAMVYFPERGPDGSWVAKKIFTKRIPHTSDSSEYVPFTLKPAPSLLHTFESIRTPTILRQYENQSDWRLPPLATKYPRFSTDRETAEKNNLEWVTPGHGLFEALRRHTSNVAQEPLNKGSCFYSLQHDSPSRIDVYRARVVDGLGDVIHERLFAIELSDNGVPRLREPNILGNFLPANIPKDLSSVATIPEAIEWLNENALMPFLNEVRLERLSELDRIAAHVELSLTELLQKADEEIGKLALEVERKAAGAEGRLAQAESRHAELLSRREKRRLELDRQRALTLQAVERITSVLILPHPERKSPEVYRLQPDSEVEAIAMQVAMEYEREKGRQVHDVHEKNFGYDLTSLDLNSGELRLIEVKGIGESTGNVLLTPNEKRVAEDRRDCYWLYVVTDCENDPKLQNPIKDPARLKWHEVKKVDHYYLSIDAVTQPMQVKEGEIPYGGRKG
ncbi:MAG: DUF3883 domain-containing protein [Thermodesulfobacteriota bacterium]